MQAFEEAINEIYQKHGGRILKERILSHGNDKETVIFGAGELGHKVFCMLQEEGIRASYFTDNYLHGAVDQRTGLRILSMEELLIKHDSSLVLVAVFDDKSRETVRRSLIENSFPEGQLIDTGDIKDVMLLSHLTEHIEDYRKVYAFLKDGHSQRAYLKRVQRTYMANDISSVVSSASEEYFDGCVRLMKEEVFVDCGGFVGDTALKFIRQVDGKYKDIFIFEPEASKLKLIRKNMSDFKYTLYQYGVWSESTILGFDDRGDVASHISEQGGAEIETCALDDLIYDVAPTYIKMDIEGAETEALKGCEKIIRKYKPKLAVCIYHKPDDLFKIPLMIHELRKDYSIYVRQYDNSLFETVCYAV